MDSRKTFAGKLGQGGRKDASPFDAVIESLVALEARIRELEDKVTGGNALELPAPPKSRLRDRTDGRLQMLEAGLLVGALARRMNLRVGAIERGVEYRRPLGLDSGVTLRSPRRLKALQARAAAKCSAPQRSTGSLLLRSRTN